MHSHSRKLINIVKRFAKRQEVVHGVEVGVWEGENASTLLDALPNVHLTLVDDYDPIKLAGPFNFMGQHDAEKAYKLAVKNMEPFQDRCVFRIMTSVEAAQHHEDGSLDFVFLDASHDYDSIKQDIEVWLPKVRRHGTFCGHDYSTRKPGVIQAVDEKFGKNIHVAFRVWTHKKGRDIDYL